VRSRIAWAGAVAIALSGCAQIVGAHFDVEPAGKGGGGAGAAGGAGGGGGAGGSVPKTELARDELPFDVAVDDTYVYWTASGPTQGMNSNGRVSRTRKDGTGPVEPIAQNQADPNRILLSSTHVYWTNTGTTVPGSVQRAAKGGGLVEVLAAPLGVPIGLDLDESRSFLYVASHDDAPSPPEQVIYRIDVSKSPAVKVPFAYVPSGASFVKLVGSDVWGTSVDAGQIWSVPKADGMTMPTPVKPTSPIPFASANALATAGGRLVVAPLGGNGDVLAITPPATTTPIGNCSGGCADVAIDAVWGYWSDTVKGTISRAPLAGGPVEVVATDLPLVNGIAVDAEWIYFAQGTSNGVVGRVKKP
jgi:hypothetical protein